MIHKSIWSAVFKGCLLCISVFATSCGDDSSELPLNPDRKRVEWKRFDRAFFEADSSFSAEDFDRLSREFPPFFERGDLRFWKAQRKDSLLNDLHRKVTELDQAFTQAEGELDACLSRYEYYYPQEAPKRVYSYISPLDFDFPLFVSDSLVFVALDQYLGESSPYYKALPEYLARQKKADRMALDLAEALAALHNRRDRAHNDLLARMIFEGKQLWFARELCPEKSEAQLLGYTQEQLDFLLENEAELWRYLIEKRALYESDPDWVRRLIEPAPFSKFYLSIDAQIPGRVGRWVGYRIVSRYMERKDAPKPVRLLEDEDSRMILKRANYRP